MLQAKLGLIIIFIVGTLWHGFPLAPVQVIVLELFMDLGASTSFVAEPAEAGIMKRPPRPASTPFFNREMMWRIGAGGISMAIATQGGYVYGYSQNMGEDTLGKSVAFVCWLLAHVMLAINQRTAVAPVLLSKDFHTNKVLLAWIAAVVVFALLIAFVEPLAEALAFRTMSSAEWGIAVAISVASTSWIELAKLAWWLRGRCCAATARAPATAAAAVVSPAAVVVAAPTPAAVAPAAAAVAGQP